MNITKLKNNIYRVREMFNGRIYSKNFPYRPTKKEAKYALDEMISKDNYIFKDEKLSECIFQYIKSKENILSPSTIRGYYKYYRLLPSKYGKIYLSEMNSMLMQNMVNDYAKSHAPKSVRNFYGFISASINMFIDKKFRVSMPANNKVDKYIPTCEEVMAVLNEAKGTRFFTPLYLASYGLRFGEIIGLTLDDIGDGEIRINKSKINGLDNKFIVKSPKTYSSNRVIPIPKHITDKIKRDKIIFDGHNATINRYLEKTCNKLNIKYFSIHKLRHFLATQLHYLNNPKRYVESFGGWESNSNVLEKIYIHSREINETIDFYNFDESYFK